MDEGRFCVLSAYDMNGLPSSLDAGAGDTTTTPTAAGGGRREEIVEAGSGSARSRSVCARACASFSRLGRWSVGLCICTSATAVYTRTLFLLLLLRTPILAIAATNKSVKENILMAFSVLVSRGFSIHTPVQTSICDI